MSLASVRSCLCQSNSKDTITKLVVSFQYSAAGVSPAVTPGRAPVAAEQRSRRGRQPREQHACEREQRDPRRDPFAEHTEAEHRHGDPDVAREEEAGERLGSARRRRETRHRDDAALEEQARARTGNDPAGEERRQTPSQVAATTRRTPADSAAVPAVRTRRMSHAREACCATTAAVKAVKAGTPASACEVWPSVTARNVGARDVKRPNAANATTPPAAAPKKRPRASAGTATRCGW